MNTLKIKNKSDSFSIYNSFVDDFIKDANPSFIKVYLYIARYSSQNVELTVESVALETGLLKSDVVSALKYWHTVGALNIRDEVLEFIDTAQTAKTKSEDGDVQTVLSGPKTDNLQATDTVVPKTGYSVNHGSVSSSYKASEVIETVTSDEKLAHLFAIIAQLLNKTLSSNDYKIIYSFIDYLELPEQVIIMLIEYCVSLSKTSMNYIEQVAISWANSGIVTPELAMQYVQKYNERNSILNNYKKKFKIVGRDFTDTEMKYIFTWVNDLKASEELIMRAYETTVMNTGKVAFKYMDSVIRGELGSNSVEKPKKLPSNIQKSTFRNMPADSSIGEIEKQMIEKMMSDFGGDPNAVDE